MSQLTDHFAQTPPGLRRCTGTNLFRSRQFYDTYPDDTLVAPLTRLLRPSLLGEFKDAYMIELLGHQDKYSESDLHQWLLAKPMAFLGELGRFESEYLGKLTFYVEALDLDVRKSHENLVMCVLLRASNSDEVVEYTLRRTASPGLIAQNEMQLPDKSLLQSKLHEFYWQKADADSG